MRLPSSKTFQEERHSFQDIPNIFWRSRYQYPTDPFEGILESTGRRLDIGDNDQPLNPSGFSDDNLRPDWPLGDTGLWVLNRRGTLSRLGKAAAKDDGTFQEAFWETLGIDIEHELHSLASSGDASDEGKPGALTAKFGTEAFGTYCPWHAFFASAVTPWGIYIFLEKLMEWACRLHSSGQYLPVPKPKLLSVFRLLWWITYRHELFHFHVEMFATRLESSLRDPVYRPYVDCVRARVANTDRWWEEALAQAVVTDSRMVKRALGINGAYMKRYMIPYFRTFPEGYKRFECESVTGGVKGAHQLLSAQIARAVVSVPDHERNTALALAKDEYGVKDDSVPGYLVLRPAFRSRFQLQTPRLKDVIRYAKRVGQIDERAPGDHKRVTINGEHIQINRAKHGDTIDLASAKALAKAMGLSLYELCQTI